MKEGFSLVELMVVVGIFSIIMLTISQPVAGIIKYQRESQITDNMRDNLQFVINKIEKELKTSSNIIVENEKSELSFRDQNNSQVIYKLEDNEIKRNNISITDSAIFKIVRLEWFNNSATRLITLVIDSESVDGRNTITMQTSVFPLNIAICPVGYIRVPGNSLYQTKDFCVMKYEAKAVEISDPTVGLTELNTGFNTIANDTTATTSASSPPRAIASVASGYPIANIDQNTATSYCTTAGASLITNAEWMTIARNIEGVASNWRDNVVGSGGLWRGHSDYIPFKALAANTDDTQGYEGTGNANETPVSRERRTHTLSNGEVIWDFSGNVWEWTSDTIQGQNKPNNSSGNYFQQWTEFNTGDIYGDLSYDLTRPSNNGWDSTQNMGKYYAGNFDNDITYSLIRGGHWAADTDAGVFALNLSPKPRIDSANYLGFRCVIK